MSNEGLTVDELRVRAARLRLVLTDCDGVLTDAGVYYSAQGEALKRFSLRDGMGVEVLRLVGVDTAIITREDSAIVARRAEKLRLPFLYLGIRDKGEHLSTVLQEARCSVEQLAYIGDDVNDLEIIKKIYDHGLTAAPADAVPAVAEAVHYRCGSGGGQGAFRDFADWLVQLRAN